MTRLQSATTAAAFLLACSSAPRHPDHVATGDYDYARAHLEWMVRNAMAKHGVKGVSLALVDDQQVVMAEGFGVADASRGVPVTGETLFRIGSISKLFTALELVRLAEAGRVDLDRDIADYVPGFAIRSRFKGTPPITPRALLAHHSGLPSDLMRGMWVERPRSLAELVDDLHEESLASPPQSVFMYSNIGYSLLGRAVEVALARPFADAMRDEILLPIGMTRSSFGPLPDLAADVAKGYRGGKEVPPYGLRDAPAGSMLSSAADMARFLRFFFAGGRAGTSSVVSEAALDDMFQQQFPGLPLDFGHEEGLGFNLSGVSASGRRAAWHMGGYPPFFAMVALLREEKLGVVVLSNSEETGKFAKDVAVKALELGLEAKRGIAPAPAPAASRSAFRPPPGAMASYAGRYALRSDLTEVSDAGDHLRIRFGGTDLDLVPISPNRFAVEKRFLFGLIRVSLAPMEVEFTQVEGHTIAVVRGLPMPITCERVDPGQIPPAWLRRLGTYQPEDLAGETFVIHSFQLENDSGILVAHVVLSGAAPGEVPVEIRVPLRPVSDDEAVVAGVGREGGATMRVLPAEGRVVLRYSGFHFIADGMGIGPQR